MALCLAAMAGDTPRPLTRAHAHNDYEHARPLLDALDYGFCSVEADIYLVNGALLVAHSRSGLKKEKTLEALYLRPLQERVEKNGGRVYPAGPEFTLLIDLKNDWHATYPVLRKTLEKYQGILSSWAAEGQRTRAVTVIITGNRSRDMFQGESVRLAALDGEIADLDRALPVALIPWISANWSAEFRWRGNGEFPESDKIKLRQIVSRAHQQARKVRFWGAPDKPAFWSVLLAEKVDLINTDDLSGLQQFLLGRANK